MFEMQFNSASSEEHVVKKGESLWLIAKKEAIHEGRHPSNAQIANRVKSIVANNQDRYPSLKSNPSFILPALHLDMTELKEIDHDSEAKHHQSHRYADSRNEQPAAAEISSLEEIGHADQQEGSAFEMLRISEKYRDCHTPIPEPHRTAFVMEALRLAGHDPCDAEVNYAKAIVSNESSFRSDAVNHADSNARAGHPSKGWAQTIDPTFRNYKVVGHNDILNPVDNLAAAIRYADARYGRNDDSHNGLRWVAINRSMRHLGY